jgi:hypothetical protein
VIVVRRLGSWSPDSTPPPGVRPENQVNTNGRGAVVYLTPAMMNPSRASVPAGGSQGFTPPRQKMMMDPTDRSTWQRPYRFT